MPAFAFGPNTSLSIIGREKECVNCWRPVESELGFWPCHSQRASFHFRPKVCVASYFWVCSDAVSGFAA